MSSDQPSPSRPSLEDVKHAIVKGTLAEIAYPRLELKSKWRTEHGKSISAIANHESLTGGWLVIG